MVKQIHTEQLFYRFIKTTPMSDDKNKRDFRDRDRINVNEPYELQYWSEKFGISKEKLRQIVEKTGPMVQDVKKQIQ